MAQGLKRVALYTLYGCLALAALSFIAGIVVGYLSAHGAEIDSARVGLGLITFVAIAAMGGAMAVTVAWMRSIDEAAREAHKSAWFWGGCGGMAVGGVLVIMASVPQAATLDIPAALGIRNDPAALMALGAATLGLLMTAGYTLAWAWWWWRRR